jgi:hypothetical protein
MTKAERKIKIMKRLSYKIIVRKVLISIIVSILGGITLGTAYGSASTESPPTTTVSNAPQVIELPDKLNTIIDKLASDSDVKHYVFTAVRGQRILIKTDSSSAESWPWMIEYNISGSWEVKRGPDTYLSPDLPIGRRIEMRVSKASGAVLKSGASYKILFGSAPRLISSKVSGDAEEFLYFGKHRAYRTINWETLVKDYKGHPLSGVEVTLELNVDQDSGAHHIVSRGVSNLSGLIRTTLNLPECQGRQATPDIWIWLNGVRRQWQLTYNQGYWYMSPEGNENGGVGGKHGEKVSFVHICSRRMLR